ncbi:MAG: DUF4065 domain-containing protein [Actinomycetaceae bacterium]|nr:DUF4065 domain-containing protein [Actinomycetaceae bacterium]
MVSVFDIASEFVDRAEGQIESVKLQKLCFYAFGWYAHLTGERLFGEQFYAMKFGPVVGQLLSAHAKRKVVDRSLLDDQFEAWDTQREELPGYVQRVIDAVWDAYGKKGAFALAEYSHSEAVWKDSWESKPKDAKRAVMELDDVVTYFLEREPRGEEDLDLPPAMLTRVDWAVLEEAEAESSIHMPFIEAFRE